MLSRPRTGRRHRRTGHFGSADRNDVPAMLSGRDMQPHLWAIVAAATTSMGHRCGCPARLSSIDVPSLRLRPRWRPGARWARNWGPGRRKPGTGSGKSREPVAGNGATAPDAVTFTLGVPEPHRWAIVAVRRPGGTASKGHRCCSRSVPAASMGHGWVSAGVRRVPDGLARAPGALRGSRSFQRHQSAPGAHRRDRGLPWMSEMPGMAGEAESSGSVRFPDSGISDQRKQASRAAAVRSAAPPRPPPPRTGH